MYNSWCPVSHIGYECLSHTILRDCELFRHFYPSPYIYLVRMEMIRHDTCNVDGVLGSVSISHRADRHSLTKRCSKSCRYTFDIIDNYFLSVDAATKYRNKTWLGRTESQRMPGVIRKRTRLQVLSSGPSSGALLTNLSYRSTATYKNQKKINKIIIKKLFLINV